MNEKEFVRRVVAANLLDSSRSRPSHFSDKPASGTRSQDCGLWDSEARRVRWLPPALGAPGIEHGVDEFHTALAFVNVRGGAWPPRFHLID